MLALVVELMSAWTNAVLSIVTLAAALVWISGELAIEAEAYSVCVPHVSGVKKVRWE
jgi:hypothetical protein